MANTIQFKRRSAGNAGAPAALKSGEVAHNEVDDTLYIGKGREGCEHLIKDIYKHIKAQQVAEQPPEYVDPRFADPTPE